MLDVTPHHQPIKLAFLTVAACGIGGFLTYPVYCPGTSGFSLRFPIFVNPNGSCFASPNPPLMSGSSSASADLRLLGASSILGLSSTWSSVESESESEAAPRSRSLRCRWRRSERSPRSRSERSRGSTSPLRCSRLWRSCLSRRARRRSLASASSRSSRAAGVVSS